MSHFWHGFAKTAENVLNYQRILREVSSVPKWKQKLRSAGKAVVGDPPPKVLFKARP